MATAISAQTKSLHDYFIEIIGCYFYSLVYELSEEDVSTVIMDAIDTEEEATDLFVLSVEENS